MRKSRTLLAATASLLLIFAAGCGSVGDVLGGGNNGSNNGSYNSTIRGTVDSVDTYGHSILLTNTSGYNTMLSGTNGGTLRVYYDNNTTVNYNGQSFRVDNLERGDQVEIQAAQNGNQVVAQAVNVTYNANQTASSSYPSGSNPSNGGYNSTVTGTVRYVNTSSHTLTIDRGYNQTAVVEYDTNTSVSYNGRNYMVTDLEPGDQVSIASRDFGGGRLVATNISVTRSVSSSSTSGTTSSQYATIRGTVQYVDTNARTITLNSTSWSTGFLPGYGNTSSVTVRYDSGMNIYVNGQAQSLSGLERGDVVDVQVRDLGNNNLLAQNITLVRDVRQ